MSELFCTSTIMKIFHIVGLLCTSTKTVLRHVLLDQDLQKGRSTEFEVSFKVNRIKYRKCQKYENGRSTEKVELMRTHNYSFKFNIICVPTQGNF